MARSLNRVQLIGNLTRDPELRYTPSGTAVCSFGIATNRSWNTDTGDKKEETEFHRIVAWNKLAELCSQFLVKGRKVYVEGRLANRSWTTPDGQQRSSTEVVIDDMILLDTRRQGEESFKNNRQDDSVAAEVGKKEPSKKAKKEEKKEEAEKASGEDDEKISPDDIPF